MTARTRAVAAADLPVEGMRLVRRRAGMAQFAAAEPSGLRGHVVVASSGPTRASMVAHTGALSGLVAALQGSGPREDWRAHSEFKLSATRKRRWAVDARKSLSRRDRQRLAVCGRSPITTARLSSLTGGSDPSSPFRRSDYERSEMVIRQLLADAGVEDFGRGWLRLTEPDEVQAIGGPRRLRATSAIPGNRIRLWRPRVVGQRHTMPRPSTCDSTLGTHGGLDRPLRRRPRSMAQRPGRRTSSTRAMLIVMDRRGRAGPFRFACS